MFSRYNVFLHRNIYLKQTPEADHTSTRRPHAYHVKAREEISKHSWFNIDSAVLHFHTGPKYSPNFSNTRVFDGRPSPFQTILCYIYNTEWIVESIVKLW